MSFFFVTSGAPNCSTRTQTRTAWPFLCDLSVQRSYGCTRAHWLRTKCATNLPSRLLRYEASTCFGTQRAACLAAMMLLGHVGASLVYTGPIAKRDAREVKRAFGARTTMRCLGTHGGTVFSNGGRKFSGVGKMNGCRI